jgi:protein-S-isoprenylcysteine O-methyltransferase Ste14
VTFPDALLAVAWLGLVADLLRSAAHAGVPAGRRATGVLLLVIMAAAAWTLEAASGGRFARHPAWTVLGVALAAAGLALHVWARTTLAHGWSSIVTPPAGAPLVEAGPYAYVRHPLYAAILLLAAGTIAVHPSRATLAAGIGFATGIALKRRAEDRALERRFGERWRAYATRVPALLPRLSRARR